MEEPKPLDSSLRIWLFGPMHVEVGGRPIPRLRSRKALWVLALLALRQGREVDRQWLAGVLWPDADTAQALANLRPALSDLRVALGAQGSRVRLEGRHTVSMDFEGAQVDVIEFDGLIEQSNLERTVELYRGPLLEGCQEQWVFQDRDRRLQACLGALEALAERSRAAGETLAVVALCKRWAALDPFSDSVHRGLMVALEEAGDRNAAMETYRKFSELLHRELNATPDKSTTDLYHRMRRDLSRRDRTVAKDAAHAIAGNLPHSVSTMVGREDERDEVMTLLGQSRLVTLTGFGGIGKTRLSLEVAGALGPEMPDGAWMVSLDSLSQGRLIADQIAVTLGVKETPGRSVDQGLIDHLRGKRLLLVLDNCEHLVESAGVISSSLLKGCAGVRILATSRLPLGIDGETVWPVPAMSTPDPARLPTGRASLQRILGGYESVRLFVDRAEAVQSGFRLNGANAPSVAGICFRLEGIPLAIELAAARMRAMTAEELADRLDDRLALLTSGSRTAPARQQTLRATLEWSHSLLSQPERILLRRLSVFRGGWTLEAARSVCGNSSPDLDIPSLLASLVDKSLVVFSTHSLGGRYRLLELVREFATEQLARSEEAASIRSNHRSWIVGLAEGFNSVTVGPEAEAQLAAIDAEHDNIRTALDACGLDQDTAEAALRITGCLHLFWLTRGYVSEGLRYVQGALDRGDAPAPSVFRATALITAASLAGRQGEADLAQRYAEEALAIWRPLDDRRGIVRSLGTLGNGALARGNYKLASEYYLEAKGILESLGHSQGVAQAVYALGMVAQSRGDCSEARSRLEESLAFFKTMGPEHMVPLNLRSLASVMSDQGDLEPARALLSECRQRDERFGDQFGVASGIQVHSQIAFCSGDLVLARRLAEESLATVREMGCRHEIASWTTAMSDIVCEQGDLAAARSLLGEALSLGRELGDRRCELDCLVAWANLALLHGDLREVRKFLSQGLELLEQVESKPAIARCMELLASVNLQEGLPREAASLWSTASALRESITVPRRVSEQAAYEAHLAQARLELGDAAFDSAWAEGLTLPWQDAIRLLQV